MTRHLAGTVDFDVTSDVAAFLAGAVNAGWLLAKTDETQSGRVDFVAREASSGQAAQLVVVFQVPSGDTTPPTLAVTSPSQPMIDNPTPPIAVTYSDSGSGVDTSTLSIALDGTALTGCTVGASSASCTSPTLEPGAHSLAASIRDRAGNAATATFSFQVEATPAVSITSPADASYSRSPSIQVTGTINGSVVAVSVNGQPATLGQGTFTATAALTAGLNQIVALSTDAVGSQASAAVVVTLDTQPPVLAITTPAPGSITNQPQVQVAGTVTDDTGIALLNVAECLEPNGTSRRQRRLGAAQRLCRLRPDPRAGHLCRQRHHPLRAVGSDHHPRQRRNLRRRHRVLPAGPDPNAAHAHGAVDLPRGRRPAAAAHRHRDLSGRHPGRPRRRRPPRSSARKDIFLPPMRVAQQVRTAAPGLDYMMAPDAWLACQNGAIAGVNRFDEQPRHIRNGRDLGEFVHRDFSY